jgi:hypothetical protein
MTTPPPPYGSVPPGGNQPSYGSRQPYGNQPPYGQPIPPPPPHPPTVAPAGFGPPPAQPAAGPEFMVFDRHNSIVLDAAGVAFEDHGLSVEFSWQEIRSIHYKASPSGKALMMAVVHLDGRFYECVVEAKPKARLGEWFAQLAGVLGHYRPMGW